MYILHIKFIDNARFMSSSLSNVVNNLSEVIHIIKCNYEHDDKKCETYSIKYKYCNCFLEYTDFKDELVEYKCLYFSKTHQHKFEEKLKERLFNKYKFSNHGNNKFVLLLQKGVSPYKYMDD